MPEMVDPLAHIFGKRLQGPLERLTPMAGGIELQILRACGQGCEQAQESVDILMWMMVAVGGCQQKRCGGVALASRRYGPNRIVDALTAPRLTETRDELIPARLADKDDLVGILSGLSKRLMQPGDVRSIEQLGQERELDVVDDVDDFGRGPKVRRAIGE